MTMIDFKCGIHSSGDLPCRQKASKWFTFDQLDEKISLLVTWCQGGEKEERDCLYIPLTNLVPREVRRKQSALQEPELQKVVSHCGVLRTELSPLQNQYISGAARRDGEEEERKSCHLS